MWHKNKDRIIRWIIATRKAIPVTALLLMGSLLAMAQQQNLFSVKNEDDKKAIEGAAVNFYAIEDTIINTLEITDERGQVIPPFDPPFIYTVRHLGYEVKSDTIKSSGPVTILLHESSTNLNAVVITGQYEPQSARNSVFNVTTLGQDRIKAQGAVSLQDVLSNVLNIRFSRDNATGISGISIQGISGQNVKVLLDGVPMVGRSGVNNEIDLNQINIEDIQRVEIVEGPMAVNYGSDALAGVINIITKKDIDGKFNLEVALHEETVGNEHSFFSKGIHAPSVQIGYKPAKHWYSQLSGRINRFGGWQGENEGRSKAWYPKTQYFFNGLLRYEKDDFSIYYKLNYLDELLENFGEVNSNNPLKDPFALDEEYHTRRWNHQIQASWNLRKIRINTAASYTDYERTTRQFIENMVTNEEQQTMSSEQDLTFYRAFFFRNTAIDILANEWLNTQIGLEGTLETAGGTKLSDGDKDLTALALFISAELKIGNRLKIRPGIRASYNSIFSTIPVPSMNLKYDFSERLQLRFGYGRGFRSPSIRELYHEFIDSNHNIIGNEDLEPEYSHNINGEISHTFEELPLQVSVGGFYNYIDNRIALYTPNDANGTTTYTNLLKYKSTGGLLQFTYNIRNLKMASGITYTGRYQLLNESFRGDIPQYLFSPEINANIQYLWAKPAISFNAFYKYTGATKNYQLIQDPETGADTPVVAKSASYQLLDLNVSKDWGKYITVSVGAKNILDVTSITNSSNDSENAHSQNGPVSIAYGRSYFLKLNFHFTK